MNEGDQTQMRNEIIAVAFKYIDKDDLKSSDVVEAFVACMGAAAVCAAVLQPAARERLIEETEGKLLEHANKRAQEMRSGQLDRQLTGH